MAADYNFGDYLSQVPDYRQNKTTAEMLAQAKAASDLAYDPIRQEAERQRKYNEMQNYNAQNRLNASQAGLNKSMDYAASQAKKANAINAAARGGGSGDGLGAYLNNLTDTALAGQRESAAAQLSANKYLQDQNWLQQDRDSQQTLGNIERQRGQAQQVYYTNQEDAEADRRHQWAMNALNVANAIGSGAMNAEDINARLQMAADQITNQQYLAELPWTKGMTPYQKEQSAQAWTSMFGGLPGGGGKDSPVALSIYASSFGGDNAPSVGWDASNGNVIIKNASGASKTYTPETLSGMGAVLDNGRWKMSQTTADQLLFNK